MELATEVEEDARAADGGALGPAVVHLVAQRGEQVDGVLGDTHVPVDEVADHLLATASRRGPAWRSRCRREARHGGARDADASPGVHPVAQLLAGFIEDARCC